MKKKIKRKDIMLKYSDILNPEYSYMKLIPSASISNYDSSALALLVNDLFKTLSQRIHFIEKRIFLEEKTSIRYMIDVSKDKVNFFYIIPSIYKNLAIDTIAKMWNGRCTVQEINKNSIRILDNPTIFQVRYKYEDSLSVKTDKKSNKFLSNSLNVIEIMGEGDIVQLAVNLIPYKRRPLEWKTFCDDTYDRFKKNLPIQKNTVDFKYLLELLRAGLGEFVNLILPEALRNTVDFRISADERKLSNSSYEKSLDASKIIDTQIAVLSKSKDKEHEELLCKSFCNSFDVISGNNELVGYKISSKKANVSIHNKLWNIYVNKMSADELSNIITIAGQEILKFFKNIEHVAIKQVQPLSELSKGIVVLGTQTYKNIKQIQYLNEYKHYGFLPILILTKMGGGKSTWFEVIGVSLMNNFREKTKNGIPVKKESFLCLDFIKQNELSYNIMNNMNPEDILLIDLSTSEGTSKLGFFFKEVEIDYTDKKKRLKLASRQGKEMMKLINYLNENTSDPLTTPMKRYLNSAFQICYIHGNKSLRDAIRIIENYDIRHEYIDMIPSDMREDLDDEIRALLELDDENNGTKLNLISGIISRTYTLQSDPVLKEMYNAKPEGGVNLVDAMQEGKGIFILMPDDEFDESMINIISTYVISRIFFACKKRGTLNANNLTRCTLLIDEINLAPGCLSTLNDIIGQLRKYKLRPIISAHNFQQIKTLKTNLTSVGLSVILPQGTSEANFLEFENYFKKEGFAVEDLQTLREYETLNLIETSEGKKAFISKFPAPVPGKIEDRDDMSVSEFKEMINDRIAKVNKSKLITNNDELEIFKKDTEMDDDFEEKILASGNIKNKYIAVDKDIINDDTNLNIIHYNNENNSSTLKDLNDKKYDYLFDIDDFDD